MTRRCGIAWLLVWLCSAGWWGAPGSSEAACGPGATPQAPGPTAPAATGTEQPPGQVILQSETLEYHPAEKRLIAEGKVVVTRGETQIFADRLELNTETGVGTASGNVRLYTPEDDVRAARADFNLTEERGVLYDSAGMVAKRFQVAGERISRVGPKAFDIQRGRVTTCTGPVPDWEFRAQKARIGLGDYVSLTQPSFWVRGIPVMYFPYLIFPVRDERTTGFLPPRVGTSEEDGTIVLTEFFWAAADWLDATVGLEYLSKKGFKPQAEFRYAIDPLSHGRLEGAYIHEQDTGDTLWRVLLQQQQEFGWGVRGLTQLDLRSDKDLVRRFSRDIREESEVRAISFGTLTKLFPNSNLTLASESYEGLPDAGITEEFRRLPTLRFTQFPTSLLGVAFFEVDTSYSRLSDTLIANNTPVQRLDLFPRLTLPLALAPWMRFAVTGGVRGTFYDHQASEGGSTSRQLVDLRAHLQGPTLWRRYTKPGTQRAVVHMIESRLDYRYVPAVEQGDIPPFDTLDEAVHFLDPLENFTLIDRITAANYAKASLINRVFTHGVTATAPRSVQEVARIILSQGFDFRDAAAGAGRLFGPLDLETTLFLWQRLQLTSVLRWRAGSGELDEVNWRMIYNIASGWAVYGANNNRFRDPETRYVTGGLLMTPLAGLQVGYNFRYDGLSGTVREHVLTLLYQAQCWNVTMRYRIKDEGDTNFFINVELFRF
jgi:LPS-assembly protein